MSIVQIVDILQRDKLIKHHITICGWVRTRRDSKAGISFLTIYDGSCFDSIQVVAGKNLLNYSKEILHLTTGCSVRIVGKIVLSLGRNQKFELNANKIEVIGWIESPNRYPLSPKKHSLEYLREFAHLRPRSNLIGAVTRIKHVLSQTLHEFFNNLGFFWVTTPLITTSNAEGTSEMFHVSKLDLKEKFNNFKDDFFGKESFLTVSGQLHGEAYACALSKIYTFGPIFRAENSNTTRHLAEFWMLEAEVAFSDLEDNIRLVKNMLKYVFKIVIKKCPNDLNFLSIFSKKNIIERLENFISSGVIEIDYSEAVTILRNSKQIFKNPIQSGIDLSSEHERYLTEKYFKKAVVIKNYPKEFKAFYMRLNDDRKTVAAMDFLVPEVGEIIGGSQREERLEILISRMNDIGLNQEKYKWYIDLRKYGTVPHSGFGLGFERLAAYITGINNLKDIIPFPRAAQYANF